LKPAKSALPDSGHSAEEKLACQYSSSHIMLVLLKIQYLGHQQHKKKADALTDIQLFN
jgi:hypothetical protein